MVRRGFQNSLNWHKLWACLLLGALLLTTQSGWAAQGKAIAKKPPTKQTKPVEAPALTKVAEPVLEPLFPTVTRKSSSEPAKAPIVLRGEISTLENAMRAEAGLVDWYAWYLACREYLAANGGVPCPTGTNLRFHKNGQIHALSPLPDCVVSVARLRFSLPTNTKLQAILLPVRSAAIRPLSPEELQSRIPET